MSRNLRDFARSAYGFDAIVQRVRDEQWSLPSPCTDWAASDVVNHIIEIHQQVLLALHADSASASSVPSPTMELPSDNVAERWTNSLAALLKALDQAGSLQQRGDTPFGRIPVDQFLGILTIDALVHTWDLAVATGQEPVLDAGLVQRGIGQMERVGSASAESGFFSPALAVHDSMPPQTRLLALTGRNVDEANQSSAGVAEVISKARSWLDNDAHAMALGVDLISATEDVVVLGLTIREEHCNSLGALHGGVSFSLADIGMSTIGNLPEPTAVAIDVHMVYAAAATVGQRVEARCTCLRRGRSLGTYRAELSVGDRLIGSFTGTVMVTSA